MTNRTFNAAAWLASGPDSQVIPEIGMAATVLHWTDRTAGTIIRLTETEMVIQADRVFRNDDNGRSAAQSYSYERNPEGYRFYLRLRNGEWRLPLAKKNSVLIGARDHYHDYSYGDVRAIDLG